MDFSVREVLRRGQAQLRSFRIKVRSDSRASVAIFSVAACTMVREIVAAFLQNFRGDGQRIFLVTSACWDSKIAHNSRNDFFDGRGLVGCAKSAPEHSAHISGGKYRKRQQHQ